MHQPEIIRLSDYLIQKQLYYLRLKDQKTNKTDLNLNIYPNPSSDEVQLYLDSNDIDFKLQGIQCAWNVNRK